MRALGELAEEVAQVKVMCNNQRLYDQLKALAEEMVQVEALKGKKSAKNQKNRCFFKKKLKKA